MSLMSEIGSLMGLLLGASVLTACELIDLVAVQAMKKLERLRKLSKSERFLVHEAMTAEIDGTTATGLHRMYSKY